MTTRMPRDKQNEARYAAVSRGRREIREKFVETAHQSATMENWAAIHGEQIRDLYVYKLPKEQLPGGEDFNPSPRTNSPAPAGPPAHGVAPVMYEGRAGAGHDMMPGNIAGTPTNAPLAPGPRVVLQAVQRYRNPAYIDTATQVDLGGWWSPPDSASQPRKIIPLARMLVNRRKRINEAIAARAAGEGESREAEEPSMA